MHVTVLCSLLLRTITMDDVPSVWMVSLQNHVLCVVFKMNKNEPVLHLDGAGPTVPILVYI